jgi:VWFA-related protein
MTSSCRRAAQYRTRSFGALAPIVALFAFVLAAPARADVVLRVEGRPSSGPIEAFVTVTDAGGNPVPGLTANDFSITIDGQPVAIQPADVTLPPSQDPNKHVSVIFVMDYSESVVDVARDAMEAAVTDFVEALNDGDFAAIVKFNTTLGVTIVHPFVTIDHGANSQSLAQAVASDYDGTDTNLLDALIVSLDHMLAPPVTLPTGPKAIILISDGGENSSTAAEADVIAEANANSIPVFTIGVGDLSVPGREELMAGLGTETGGGYFPAPTDQDIADAYATISTRLNNEYLITIPSGLTNCEEHVLEVTVTGQMPVSASFTRRTCDTTPDAFGFNAVTGVNRGATVQSNAVEINGLEVPAHISVIQGEYSIGCTDANFTRDPATIDNGDTVCVRHTASNSFSTNRTTTLTVGGFAATFTSTTRADPGNGGGGGGGGGSTGLPELLLGLAALAFARRRHAA